MNNLREIGANGNLVEEEKSPRDYMINYTHHEEARLTRINKPKTTVVNKDKLKPRSNNSGIHPVTIRAAKTPRKR